MTFSTSASDAVVVSPGVVIAASGSRRLELLSVVGVSAAWRMLAQRTPTKIKARRYVLFFMIHPIQVRGFYGVRSGSHRTNLFDSPISTNLKCMVSLGEPFGYSILRKTLSHLRNRTCEVQVQVQVQVMPS